MSRFIKLFSMLLVLFMLSVGCSGAQGNTQSGSDGVKAGAKEVPLGRMDHGTVNADGDRTDWRYFRIPATGMVDITLSFDNPEARGTAIIRDASGMQVARMTHQGQPLLRATFRGETGIYYAEIFAQSGQTPYTFQIDFTPLY